METASETCAVSCRGWTTWPNWVWTRSGCRRFSPPRWPTSGMTSRISAGSTPCSWGEDATSYRLDYKGFDGAPTTASQTAWALLGLMAAGEVENPAVARGVEYLMTTQTEKGLWDEQRYTATGFPRVFYLRYHGYSKFFPLWALARFRNLRKTNSRVVGVGM